MPSTRTIKKKRRKRRKKKTRNITTIAHEPHLEFLANLIKSGGEQALKILPKLINAQKEVRGILK